MSKNEFVLRKHRNPDYKLTVAITGVKLHDGRVNWNVERSGHGADNDEFVAELLEKVAGMIRGEK